MKTIMLYSVFLIFAINSFAFSMDLDYIRNHYGLAASDKKICREMITELEKTPLTSVHLAYLGALQTIWANHVVNPFSKLSTFSKGKAAIVDAVKKDSNNFEIRLVRLSVQKNCPAFLGYNKNIQEDEEFLKKNKEQINSTAVLNLLDSVLK
ncbi:hypothetical protein [Flavobacterium sp. HJJ]|uniref:hypothetical protein n=1 Tax=Flavobacterium sp. HJJ TaxID=2783792 RepID=UPI00188A02BC|nr:hypothetical protein [Flavobacterium sp. HJJ]MBF4471108.1 hypothetical protein [Flavobacterium sp. HJJ]